MNNINLELFNEPSYFLIENDLDNISLSDIESSRINRDNIDILEYFRIFNIQNNTESLDEASYQERAKTAIFRAELMDIPKFIEKNNLQEITNPIFFSPGGYPTPDGLLSNNIFGTQDRDRSGIFAYISLGDYFIDPSCYKILGKLDGKFKQVVNGTDTFIINKEGMLEQSNDGDTGIRWLRKNFDKLKFKRTESQTRDIRIKYIQHNYKLGRLFINKYIVIPPYYRDVNTSGKYTGVGQINTLYSNLIVAAKALEDSRDYGLSMADSTCARIQNTLVQIYDWFCGNDNPNTKDKGTGMSGKFGIIRRANMSYTSDYSSRLVLSAPELKVETINDMMVNLDKSAMPLAAVAADFYPFMMYHMRKFFENELLNSTTYETVMDGEPVTVRLNNPMLDFSDDVLENRLKQFCYSRDTRMTPVELPGVVQEDPNKVLFMWFKAERWQTPEEAREGVEPILQRPLTWVDVIYIAAKRATEGKKISITRFPYDSYFNTIYTGIEVSSTKETEPLYINGEYYQFYPKIRIGDILQPSKNKFIDTMRLSNLYLGGMGGDYDGDTIVAKGSFFNETNDELANFVDSKANYIDLGCSNIRKSSNEAVQAIYNLTKVLKNDTSKLTDPQF